MYGNDLGLSGLGWGRGRDDLRVQSKEVVAIVMELLQRRLVDGAELLLVEGGTICLLLWWRHAVLPRARLIILLVNGPLVVRRAPRGVILILIIRLAAILLPKLIIMILILLTRLPAVRVAPGVRGPPRISSATPGACGPPRVRSPLLRLIRLARTPGYCSVELFPAPHHLPVQSVPLAAQCRSLTHQALPYASKTTALSPYGVRAYKKAVLMVVRAFVCHLGRTYVRT